MCCIAVRVRGAYRAHLVLNFRDLAPPSPRGVLANATPRRFPLRLITRNLSSGICPSLFSSFSNSTLNAASASTIASKDFFTAAGKSSASMFCHFNSSFAIVLLHPGRRKGTHAPHSPTAALGLLPHGVGPWCAVLISDSLALSARVRKGPKRLAMRGVKDPDLGGRYADICGLQHVRRVT